MASGRYCTPMRIVSLVCFLLAGCAAPASHTVTIDAAFSEAEVECLRHSAGAWHLEVARVLGHAEIIGEALEKRGGFYIVKVASATDTDCPNQNRALDQQGLGLIASELYGVVCVNAPAVDANEAWGNVATHELGHALGLGHKTEGIMTANVPRGVVLPTELELREVGQ